MYDLFGLNPSSYSIAINLLIRLIGLIYVVAYIPFLSQILGLLGKDGILPAVDYLEFIKRRFGKKRFYYVPTLFWFNASDTALLALIWSGITLGVLLMFGVMPLAVLLLLYLVHLSLSSVGQDFLGFGWEVFLMEITIACALTYATCPFNIFGWINLNFLLLRFMFQAGASKLLSGDRSWRQLTALDYHYFTQPLPNRVAWYFHQLPQWFHKCCVAAMFYIELIVPLAIFTPPEVRFLVFIQLVGLQIGIWLTGNLSYLNHLTAVFCVILLHNKYLEPFFGDYFGAMASSEASPIVWQVLVSFLGVILLGLQVVCFAQPFLRNRYLQKIIVAIDSFRISTPHGIFAVMTTQRVEIVVEGSLDGVLWKEYLFFYKPQELSRRPRRISPYQPRLDWQAWFLPFRPFQFEWWFQRFLTKLLQGSPSVLKLLKHNPFPEKPPVYVRALAYDYKFTTCKEKAETGNWWKRRLLGSFAFPQQLIK
jgi:lipase maturation factor 1